MNRRTVIGSLAAAAPAFGANDRVQIACIGTGGRCRALMRALSGIASAKIVALADVRDDALAAAKAMVPDAATTKEYETLLARRDIDAVVIASPDHQHVPMLEAACRAGKDVYVEKPLTHELREGAAALEAQNRYGRVVQVGMQQRSMPHIRKGYELVQAGALGKIHKVHLTWNRNSVRGATRPEIDASTVNWKAWLGKARPQPYDPYRMTQWRWFWDFGGGVFTDLMVHWIDVAHWYLGLDHPSEAVAIGDNFQNKTWETPDTAQTLLRYAGREVQVYFEATFVNQRNAAMIEFMGSEATLYVDRGRYELHPEPGRKAEYRELILGEGRRGADFYKQPDGELLHFENWLAAVRSRSRPNTPVEAGISAASAAHLANRALREKSVAKWEG